MSVPPLLLQPLVENSLKHGVPSTREPLRMTLTARQAEGWLELEFGDDGKPHGNGGPGLGVGLENLEQRVRRFAGPGASVDFGPARRRRDSSSRCAGPAKRETHR